MTIQFEVWQLATLIITLGGAFLGFVFAAGRLLLAQIDQRLDQRFAVIEGTLADVQKLEKDFLRFQADLPLHMCGARIMSATRPSWKRSSMRLPSGSKT